VLTDVDIYCKSIRDIKPEKKTLSVKEFVEGMKAHHSKWQNVTDDSVFMQVLNECSVLKDEDKPTELSKNALLLWGIVLCSGKSKIKVTAFYDILQDNNQERISAEDKDFPGNFSLMVDLATKIVNEYEPRISHKDAERSAEFIAKLDSLKPTLAEIEFLDPVFESNSHIRRDEWEKRVLTETKWVFDSNKVRAHIYSKVEKM
jgi:hypothetical protein